MAANDQTNDWTPSGDIQGFSFNENLDDMDIDDVVRHLTEQISPKTNDHPSQGFEGGSIQQGGGYEEHFDFDRFSIDNLNALQASSNNGPSEGHVSTEPAMYSNAMYNQGTSAPNERTPSNQPMPPFLPTTQQNYQSIQPFENQTRWDHQPAHNLQVPTNRLYNQPDKQMNKSNYPMPLRPIDQSRQTSHQVYGHTSQPTPFLVHQNNVPSQPRRALQNIVPASTSRLQQGTSKRAGGIPATSMPNHNRVANNQHSVQPFRGQMSQGQAPFPEDNQHEELEDYPPEDAVGGEMKEVPRAAARAPERRAHKKTTSKAQKSGIRRDPAPSDGNDGEENEGESDAPADPDVPTETPFLPYEGRFDTADDALTHLNRLAMTGMVEFPGRRDDEDEVFDELHTYGQQFMAAMTAEWSPHEQLVQPSSIEHFNHCQEESLKAIRKVLQEQPLNAEARIVVEMHKVIQVHKEPQIIKDGTDSNKVGSFTEEGMTCSQRMRKVIQMVQGDKRVAHDVLHGRTGDHLARAPEKYYDTKRQNALINERKKRRTDGERRAAAEVQRLKAQAAKKTASKPRPVGKKGKKSASNSALPAHSNEVGEPVGYEAPGRVPNATQGSSRPATGPMTPARTPKRPKPFQRLNPALTAPSVKPSYKGKGKGRAMGPTPDDSADNSQDGSNSGEESDNQPSDEDDENSHESDSEFEEEEDEPLPVTRKRGAGPTRRQAAKKPCRR